MLYIGWSLFPSDENASVQYVMNVLLASEKLDTGLTQPGNVCGHLLVGPKKPLKIEDLTNQIVLILSSPKLFNMKVLFTKIYNRKFSKLW